MSFMDVCLRNWEVEGLIRKLTPEEKERLKIQYADDMRLFDQEFGFNYQLGLVIGILLIPVLLGFVIIYLVEKNHQNLKSILLKDAYERALFISGLNPLQKDGGK